MNSEYEKRIRLEYELRQLLIALDERIEVLRRNDKYLDDLLTKIEEKRVELRNIGEWYH